MKTALRALLFLTLPAMQVTQSADSLALVVSAARAPAAPLAARVQLAEFAQSHAATQDGALAQMALGLVEYEHGDFAGAARDLDGLFTRLPQIADYVAYYQASAQAQLSDEASAATTLAKPAWDRPLSPLKPRADLLRADALVKSGHAGEAADLLHAAYKKLPQPDAALALASAYDARGENVQAAAFYQRVFYGYPATPAAATAAAALDRLKPLLGKNFPLPSAQQLVERPSRWIEAHQYVKATLRI